MKNHAVNYSVLNDGGLFPMPKKTNTNFYCSEISAIPCNSMMLNFELLHGIALIFLFEDFT